ncbi:MerR family transcriptional regulator [Deinococcus yavapaiensis]|uniref:DNA-binding transcriptional MerR regulator n=1 Tax=Deinococcus yavapaiensis KR-236 TaxID=694435 RepID=A0A318RZI9_9DEIO|nr:MerR family transcriptional regulator [Deinococcus yavapaiensis]PYE49457.1 DNA-binding transcriptional MerR regulator [Deinococcus yavapaiensis KR-236]
MDVSKEALFSIGQFAKLSNISIKTLRYYDAEGLLKPAYIDAQSNYRYYTPTQLEHARLLQKLRFIHVPLDVLRDFMQCPTEAYLQEVLDRYERQLQQELETLTGRIEGIRRRRAYPRDLRPYDVRVEIRPSVPFVYLHYQVGLSRIEEARDLAFKELRAYLARFSMEPASPPMCFGPPHPPSRDDQVVHQVIAGFEVSQPVPDEGRILSGWTPGGTWYTARHHGLYDYIGYAKAPTFQRAREDGVPIGKGSEEFWHAEVYRIGPWDTPDLGQLLTDVRWLLEADTLGTLALPT